MSPTVTTPNAPSVRVLAFVAFVVFLLTAGALAIFETGTVGERAQVLDAIKYVGPALLAAIPASAAFLRGESTRQIVAKIDTQTNGSLDARIRTGALDALRDWHTPAAPTGTQPAADSLSALIPAQTIPAPLVGVVDPTQPPPEAQP